jgi:hypothetical protein
MNIKTSNEKNLLTCTDLALAATISLFYPLESIDKQNPHKAQFIFTRNAHLNKIIESYWRGELKVEPKQYFNALRTIKAQLYG